MSGTHVQNVSLVGVCIALSISAWLAGWAAFAPVLLLLLSELPPLQAVKPRLAVMNSAAMHDGPRRLIERLNRLMWSVSFGGWSDQAGLADCAVVWSTVLGGAGRKRAHVALRGCGGSGVPCPASGGSRGTSGPCRGVDADCRTTRQIGGWGMLGVLSVGGSICRTKRSRPWR